jgi:hypothetical protein
MLMLSLTSSRTVSGLGGWKVAVVGASYSNLIVV